MIKDVETGTVNCIVCKTLARAFRNYSDQGYFPEKVFPLHGKRTFGWERADNLSDI